MNLHWFFEILGGHKAVSGPLRYGAANALNLLPLSA